MSTHTLQVTRIEAARRDLEFDLECPCGFTITLRLLDMIASGDMEIEHDGNLIHFSYISESTPPIFGEFLSRFE